VRIINEKKLDFKDVMIVPKRSTLTSRKDVELTKEYLFKWSPHVYQGVPIMASNMEGVGTLYNAHILAEHGLFTCLHKNEHVADLEARRLEDSVARTFSLGDLTRLPTIYACLDVANGYQEQFLRYVSRFRESQPDAVIIAGNVVTPEMTEALLLEGADIVKVGIGSGAACATRDKTGVGYPQLSAVIECADAAHGLGGHIISDGGCRTPSDVAKAFGAGADFVMLGYMLASKELKGNAYANDEAYKTSEGICIEVPNRTLTNAVLDILGGLRSTCTYVGAASLKELPKRTTFVKVQS
jgi:GMP reductase